MKFYEALKQLLTNVGPVTVKDPIGETWNLKDLLDEEQRSIEVYGNTTEGQNFEVDSEGVVEVQDEYHRKRWVTVVE